MMKHKRWWILFSVVSVLLMLGAVRAIWRPSSSHGANRTAVCERPAQTNEKVMEARFKSALESIDPNGTEAADTETLKELEAAKEAQLKQQETTEEVQPTQEEIPCQLSENTDLSIEAVVGTGDEFYALIGDKRVREGDVVNGYHVVKICADRVELTKDGAVFIEKMN